MNANVRLALSLGLALVFTGAALAQQTTTPAADPGAPPPPRVHAQGGVEYLNGGAGEEARAAIVALSGGFPLRIVFSAPGGVYTVADHVDVANATGKVLSVDNAGPLLAIKVPPGDYSIDVNVGGKVERRPIHLGREAVTLNWRLPEAGR